MAFRAVSTAPVSSAFTSTASIYPTSRTHLRCIIYRGGVSARVLAESTPSAVTFGAPHFDRAIPRDDLSLSLFRQSDMHGLNLPAETVRARYRQVNVTIMPRRGVLSTAMESFTVTL